MFYLYNNFGVVLVMYEGGGIQTQGVDTPTATLR